MGAAIMSVLGATASGLYWMFRNLERSDSATRVIEATLRVSFTDAELGRMEWESIITSSGLREYWNQHSSAMPSEVPTAELINFLLSNPDNPSSLLATITSAHANARRVRTALSRETAEAINSTASQAASLIRGTQELADLPETLATLRRLLAQVHGAHAVTAMRNENFSFGRLGTFIERADATARIVSAKTVALSAESQAGLQLENLHFDTVLRSVAAHRAFRWVDSGTMTGPAIADFLLCSLRMPRSLAYSFHKVVENLGHLSDDYGTVQPSAELALALLDKCSNRASSDLIDEGLHLFLDGIMQDINELGLQISTDYRFDR